MRSSALITLSTTLTMCTACLDASPAPQEPSSTEQPGTRGGKGDTSQDEAYFDARTHSDSGESWTYMVYMMADNNLEEDGMNDLREMAQVGSNEHFNIVVLSDRGPGHDEEGVLNLENWEDTKTLHVQNGALEVVREHGELDLGDPQNLVEFVRWTAENYPADRYAISFWDHGGSWNGGFGPDDTTLHNEQGDGTLYISEFSEALPAALAAAGIKQFDFIGFDTCLLGTWSQIQTVKPHAEYMLASEELEPGAGWDYTALETLRDTPTATGKQLGEALLERYATHHDDPWITLSLIDLYALDDLDIALTLWASDMSTQLEAHAVTLAQARANVKEYGSPDGGAPSKYGTVDLGAFVTELAKRDPTFAPERDAIMLGIERAVIAQVKGPAAPEATGIAIYMPQYSVLYDANYLTLGLASLSNWALLVDDYAAFGPTGDSPGFGDFDAPPEIIDQGLTFMLEAPMQINADTLVEARAPHGFIYEEGILLFGEEVAQVQGDVVSSQWDGSYLEMVQGEMTAPVYFEQRRDEAGYLKASLPMYYLPAGADIEDAQEASLVYTINEATGEEHTRLFAKTRTGTVGELIPEEGSQLIPYVYFLDEDTFEKHPYTLDDDVSFDANAPYGFRIAGLSTATHFMMLELYGVIGLSDVITGAIYK